MAFPVVLLTLLVVAFVVLVVAAPLRHRQGPGQARHRASHASTSADQPSSGMSAEHMDDLQAAREAKYREIRDAELDYRTGKLSREDYEAIDADLRAEALDILNRLEPSNRPFGEAEGDTPVDLGADA